MTGHAEYHALRRVRLSGEPQRDRRFGSRSRSLARPRSRFSTRPSFMTKTFSGLMSRRRSLCSYAAASPVATAITYSTALSLLQRAVSQMSRSVRPCRISLTISQSILHTCRCHRHPGCRVDSAPPASRFLIEATQPRSVGRVVAKDSSMRRPTRAARPAQIRPRPFRPCRARSRIRYGPTVSPGTRAIGGGRALIIG